MTGFVRPVALVNPYSVRTLAGSDVTLTCEAIVFGAPDVSFKWSRPVPVPVSSPQYVSAAGPMLALKDLSPVQAGPYVCTVETAGGKSESRSLIFVQRKL